MVSSGIYTVGGAVQAGGENAVYLSRSADDELFELCKQSKFSYVLTPRQMGKTSLIVRIAERLEEVGIISINIDLQEFGVKVTAEQWYLGLLIKLEDELDLDTDVVDWWQERSKIGVTQRLNQFFQDVLLTEIAEPIVIFIDEIDTTLSLDFTDDLYAAIRFLYLSRSLKPELRRLSFVLVGVATPSDLIRDPKRTPFNIGERVDLTDFTFEEALPLAQGLELEAEAAQQVLQWVLQWTEGHPYLTQRLFQELIEQERPDWSQAAVDEVVARSFFGKESERDSNLQFVRDMLTKRSPDLSEGLLTYREVWRGRKPVLDEEQSLVKSHLKLSGVVLRDEARLQVRNPIYRQVFDEEWVRKHLPINWKKRLQRLGIGLGVLFLLAPTPAAIFSYRQYQKAEAARQQAEVAREEAIKQKNIAETERQEAERQRILAEEAQTEAEEQREFAEIRKNVAIKARQKELEQKKIAQKKQQEAEAARIAEKEQREIAEERRLEAIAAQKEAERAQVEEAKARLEAEEQRKIAAQGRDEAQIVTLITSAERRFDSSPGIASVIEALKAGKELQVLEAKLKKSDPERKVDSATKMRIVTALRQIVYEALERNRLEHDEAVRTVSISPDDRIIASAGDDGIIKLWNPDGSLKNAIKAHQVVNVCLRTKDGTIEEPRGIIDINFSSDNKTIASVGADGSVKLWNLDGSLIKTLRESQISESEDPDCQLYSPPVGSVSFSPDSQIIAFSGNENTVQLLKSDGSVITTLKGNTDQEHTDKVTDISFSKDHQMIATASLDNTVKLWNLDGTLINTLEEHDDIPVGVVEEKIIYKKGVMSVAFSPENDMIASAGADQTVKLWNLDGTLITSLTGHSDTVTSVDFSADDKTIISASKDRTIKIWQKNSSLITTLRGNSSQISDISIGQEGKIIASASTDKTVKFWRSNEIPVKILKGHSGQIDEVSFSPDGSMIATASFDKTVKLWNRDGNLIKTFEGHNDEVESVKFSPNSQIIASGSRRDNKVKLWGIDGKLLQTLTANIDYIKEVTFSPDGQMIMAATDVSSGGIVLWDLNGTLIRNFIKPTSSSEFIWSISVSPDGNIIATGDSGNKLRLWKLDGTLIKTLEGHDHWVNHVSYSPDGEIIASGSWDRTIKLWNRDGTLLKTLEGHNGDIVSINFSTDSNSIISAGKDAVKLWRRDGALIATISNQSSRCASFSPDDNLIAICQGNEIVLLNLELNTLLQKGCDSLHNYLVNNPKVSDEEVELCPSAKLERQRKQNN